MVQPMNALRRFIHAQEGSSVTELAIVAPVFVALILWSFYFHDLMEARLRIQEAARFAAWEFTAFPLSDYSPPVDDSANMPAKHQAYFDFAAQKIAQDVNDLYGQSLDSAFYKKPVNRPWTKQALASVTTANFENQDAKLFNGDGVQETIDGLGSAFGINAGGFGNIANKVSGMIDKIAEPYYGFLGFDMKGRIHVTVQGSVKNSWMPQTFLNGEGGMNFYREQLIKASAADVTLPKEELTLVADTWKLQDGMDTVLPGYHDTSSLNDEQMGRRTQFRNQVDRMMYLGLAKLLEQQEPFSQLENFIGQFVKVTGDLGENINPLWFIKGKVVSKAYTTDQKDSVDGPAAQDFSVKPYWIDGGQKRFHTIEYRADFGYDDEYWHTHQKMGNHMYGCPTARKLPGDCKNGW